jgi:oligosaccharide translocation protein RFT1
MRQLQTDVRVRAEMLGVTSKAVVTLLVLFYDSRSFAHPGEYALVAFALGQLAYSIVLIWVYGNRYGRNFLPRALSLSPRLRCVAIF